MELIDKAVVVAEIERIKENANKRGYIGKCSVIVVCDELLSFLGALEVKEVDLDELEENKYFEKELKAFVVGIIDDCHIEIAKHFFELGLKQAVRYYNINYI